MPGLLGWKQNIEEPEKKSNYQLGLIVAMSAFSMVSLFASHGIGHQLNVVGIGHRGNKLHIGASRQQI